MLFQTIKFELQTVASIFDKLNYYESLESCGAPVVVDAKALDYAEEMSETEQEGTLKIKFSNYTVQLKCKINCVMFVKGNFFIS